MNHTTMQYLNMVLRLVHAGRSPEQAIHDVSEAYALSANTRAELLEKTEKLRFITDSSK